jgi:hypothetical protein
MTETEYLMKVRNIICHNPLVIGDTGVPQTRSNWKTGTIVINQKSLEQVARAIREVCNALYEGYRDTWDHQASYTAEPTKWAKLSDDLD